MRVFVIEDSSVIRERLHERLNNIPSVELVGETENKAVAVQSICTLKPDVVILGFSTAMDNLEVLRRIKMQPLSISVIVLSNMVYSQYQKKCIDTGADYFLDKSRDIEVLTNLLTSMVKELSIKNRAGDKAGND